MSEQETIQSLKYLKRTEFVQENFNIDVLDVAISALDKQIPQKPVRPYESNYKQYWNCPSCGSSGMHDVHKYCWRCGQKLEWEES